MYKGGFIVPILIRNIIYCITFFFRAFNYYSKSKWCWNTDKFVAKIKGLIAKDFDGAIAACDKQKGSLGNVVREGLLKYQFVQNDNTYG
jgi:biopolymer transport protein ExbB